MEAGRWLPAHGELQANQRVSGAWVPQTLASVLDAGELEESWCYVVVDEVVGDRVGLSVARWPRVDDRRRLRFGDSSEGEDLIGVPRDGFRNFVNRSRVVMVMTRAGEVDRETADALRARNTRIGDVFAMPGGVVAELANQADGDQLEIRDDVLIYDISYEAREQAKLAGAAAVAPPLDDEEARLFLREDGPDGADGDITPGDGPDDDGPGGSPPERPRPAGLGPDGDMLAVERVAELET